MEKHRLFSDVPRNLLTIATVVGGLIGLILSQIFQWTSNVTFFVTLGVALLCIAATILVYRALHRGKAQ
jgi:predicted MFS family arabinose efflux permease